MGEAPLRVPPAENRGGRSGCHKGFDIVKLTGGCISHVASMMQRVLEELSMMWGRESDGRDDGFSGQRVK